MDLNKSVAQNTNGQKKDFHNSIFKQLYHNADDCISITNQPLLPQEFHMIFCSNRIDSIATNHYVSNSMKAAFLLMMEKSKYPNETFYVFNTISKKLQLIHLYSTSTYWFVDKLIAPHVVENQTSVTLRLILKVCKRFCENYHSDPKVIHRVVRAVERSYRGEIDEELDCDNGVFTFIRDFLAQAVSLVSVPVNQRSELVDKLVQKNIDTFTQQFSDNNDSTFGSTSSLVDSTSDKDDEYDRNRRIKNLHGKIEKSYSDLKYNRSDPVVARPTTTTADWWKKPSKPATTAATATTAPTTSTARKVQFADDGPHTSGSQMGGHVGSSDHPDNTFVDYRRRMSSVANNIVDATDSEDEDYKIDVIGLDDPPEINDSADEQQPGEIIPSPMTPAAVAPIVPPPSLYADVPNPDSDDEGVVGDAEPLDGEIQTSPSSEPASAHAGVSATSMADTSVSDAQLVQARKEHLVYLLEEFKSMNLQSPEISKQISELAGMLANTSIPTVEDTIPTVPAAVPTAEASVPTAAVPTVEASVPTATDLPIQQILSIGDVSDVNFLDFESEPEPEIDTDVEAEIQPDTHPEVQPQPDTPEPLYSFDVEPDYPQADLPIQADPPTVYPELPTEELTPVPDIKTQLAEINATLDKEPTTPIAIDPDVHSFKPTFSAMARLNDKRRLKRQLIESLPTAESLASISLNVNPLDAKPPPIALPTVLESPTKPIRRYINPVGSEYYYNPFLQKPEPVAEPVAEPMAVPAAVPIDTESTIGTESSAESSVATESTSISDTPTPPTDGARPRTLSASDPLESTTSDIAPSASGYISDPQSYTADTAVDVPAVAATVPTITTISATPLAASTPTDTPPAVVPATDVQLSDLVKFVSKVKLSKMFTAENAPHVALYATGGRQRNQPLGSGPKQDLHDYDILKLTSTAAIVPNTSFETKKQREERYHPYKKIKYEAV